jgi:hypothetical protein
MIANEDDRARVSVATADVDLTSQRPILPNDKVGDTVEPLISFDSAQDAGLASYGGENGE